jgi:hypothetical protein
MNNLHWNTSDDSQNYWMPGLEYEGLRRNLRTAYDFAQWDKDGERENKTKAYESYEHQALEIGNADYTETRKVLNWECWI